MIKNDGYSMHNNKYNNNGTKLFKLPIKKIKNQSRNTDINNNLTKIDNQRKYSLYSTKEATPRKEYNPVIQNSNRKNSCYPSNEKIDLDDSLSNISQILNSNKKDLNYSGFIGKFPGFNDEPNFVYDQILFNKSSINKAKILSHKIGVLKLPISNISSKEALSNSNSNSGREKKCFSDRVQEVGGLSGNKKKKNKNIENDSVGVTCCFFGRK